MSHIRPIVICVFRNGERILVFEGHDPVKNENFYRPLGGGIEFGESSELALRREIMEELGEQITDVNHLCTLENIFTFNGKPGHEIVQVYEGKFLNAELYDQPDFFGVEDNGECFKVTWKSLDEFGPQAPLYPDGLLERLK